MRQIVAAVLLLTLVGPAGAAPLTFDFLWNSSGNAGPNGRFEDFDITARSPATLTTGTDGRKFLSFSWNGRTWGGPVCTPPSDRGEPSDFVAPAPAAVGGALPGGCVFGLLGPESNPLGFAVIYDGLGSNVGPFVHFEGVGVRPATTGIATPPPAAPAALKVALTSPRAGATVAGTVIVNIWVEGAAAGTSTFTLAVDGKSIATQRCACAHVWPAWNTRLHGNGTHSVLASVLDSGGRSGSVTITVLVNN